jgi:predicted ribosomally synthesized peptide with SipW-like signal peptide
MKIIKSLAIVLTLAVIAAGATWSFFGDEEKSTGNTFSAGKIDLKVDNQTHYNGCVCNNGEWDCEPWADFIVSESQGKRRNGTAVLLERSDVGSALGAAETAGADSDPSPQPWTFYSLGFGGTAVIKFDNLIMNGTGPDLKVFEVTGGTYPDETAEISASQDGTTWTVLGTATRDEELDLGALPWAKYVKVKDTSNVALFESTADGFDLDAIKASHCDCVPPELEEQTCSNMTWSETDLGPQKFFNFSDIKPGDVGEDTVSLHVYDNDAWGRMIIDVTKDDDNTCTEPEEDEEDNCDENGDNNGELRENLDFMVWLDEGFTPGFQGKNQQGKMIDIAEGNNRLDQSEIVLIQPGEIDAPQEIHNIWEGLMLAYTSHNCLDTDGNTNYGNCHGLAKDGRMVASTTYYFGMGWILPGETGNEVQSDIFQGDITFEVEQYRNNPNPFQ